MPGGHTYNDVVTIFDELRLHQVLWDAVKQHTRFATTGPIVALVGGAPLLLDGLSPVVAGNRVLVKNQGDAPVLDATQNGLYRVVVPGGGATGTWVRDLDMDTSNEVTPTTLVGVREGATNGGKFFQLSVPPGPVVLGLTPITFLLSFSPGGGGAGTAVLDWGAGSVNPTTTTRFLYPWYDDDLAQVTAIRWRAPRAGTLRNLYVRHNAPAGNGNLIVYRVRVNGVATLLLVSLASTATDGSNLVNTVAIAAGDLLDIVVTKALVVGASPTDITAALEFA